MIEIDLSDAPLPFEEASPSAYLAALIHNHPILFLDIDGVLRPAKPFDDRLDSACVSRLNALAERLDARIVISSTWRWVWPLERFNAVLAGRVIGLTPDVAADPSGAAPDRWNEITAWIRTNGRPRRFIAIDDQPSGFPASCCHVHYTDPNSRLTSADVEQIAAALS